MNEETLKCQRKKLAKSEMSWLNLLTEILHMFTSHAVNGCCVPACHWQAQTLPPLRGRLLPPQSSFLQPQERESWWCRPARTPPEHSPRLFLEVTGVEKKFVSFKQKLNNKELKS